MTVSLDEFERAIIALERALALPLDDVVRDASIQRFEFCIELAWKTARKVMGTQSTAPKQVVRDMHHNDLVDSPQPWFEALEHRNLSVHTYNEDVAQQVYGFAQRFAPEFRALLTRLMAAL
jgi:nucleotidyltransferase substrate binding protein (TIGR01987 family)